MTWHTGAVGRLVCALIAAALVAVAAAPARAQSGTAARAQAQSASVPAAAWTQIAGGAGTSCAEGAPFSFYVHLGDPRRVLIFLSGGGACWNAKTCVEHPTFAAEVDSIDPARLRGILDLTRAENPFREYTAIRIPYCTGDVHLGRRDTPYEVVDSTGHPVRSVVIHHDGNANVEDALEWVFRSVADPRVVVVVGSSAGGIASPFYAAIVAEHYPRARVVQLGDGSGGYRGRSVTETLDAWGTAGVLHGERAYADLDSSSITVETIYSRAARAAPRVRFAQVNTAADSIQIFFLGLLGMKKAPLDSLLTESFAEIRASIPGFRYYTAAGPMHTVIGRPEFYTLRVDGVRLRDWVANLVAGRSVENVGEGLLRPRRPKKRH